MHRLALLLLTLSAFVLRVWQLDAKGLSYDEAATALMARATPFAIIDFHWHAAFEHPPIWQLLMHTWSLWAGQSEFALRLPSVLAGTVAIPLLWQLAYRFRLNHATALTAALLATVAPILVYYSQEARMYALVVLFALVSLIATQSVATPQLSPGSRWAAALVYVPINWVMLGLHYYAALLLVAEAIFLLAQLAYERQPLHRWLWTGTVSVLAGAPLAAWMLLAPGFRDTVTSVLNDTVRTEPTPLQFLDNLWRDLTFAAIRWETETAAWGYLLLPLVLLGFIHWLSRRREKSHQQISRDWGLLLLLAWLVPVIITLFVSRTLATRYILYIVPPLLVGMAAAVAWGSRIHRVVGMVLLLVALMPSAFALPRYFDSYQKSAYREMVTYLNRQRQPDEPLMLEAPRQHLLAKYYLPTVTDFLTAPVIELPEFWPVNALPVVPEEMDDYIQSALRTHPGLWLSLSAENEVDPGEFVPKYLTAVAFEHGCHGWLDVRLCHYVSAHSVEPQRAVAVNALFAEELLLQQATLAVLPTHGDEPSALLVTLHWLAHAKPTKDYRVTLRLIDAAGVVQNQRDNFPIGPLLPPSTWNAGDAKPGYMALPVPHGVAPGEYQLAVNLYDPATLAPVVHTRTGEAATDSALILVAVRIGDTIEFFENNRVP